MCCGGEGGGGGVGGEIGVGVDWRMTRKLGIDQMIR